MLETILTPWRVKWYSRGALFALAVAFVVILVSGSGTTTLTGRIGGDYPAFYSAGQIIADGEAENLYSLRTQREYQQELIGDQSGVLAFAYPPHFALFYAPLSELPFRVSYAVHTLAMVAALALACLLIQRIYPNLIAKPELLFFLAFTAYPIFRSVIGGQNTALSILLIVLCWYKVLHNKHYQAGIYLGLLLFKPQFALPLAGLFLLSGRWRVWVSAGATGIVLIALNSALLGPGWFADWFDIVRTFSRFDVQVNFAELVSWQGFIQAVVGQGNSFAVALGWGLSGATILAISWVWFAGGRTADFNSQLALASICIVLISPHTLYYDSGIVLIAVVVLLNRFGRLKVNLILGVWAAGILQLLSPALGVSLSFI
ncbi:MAG: glycosyltransferase family 87 protein, partial [Alphaproteobacteria bacterium]